LKQPSTTASREPDMKMRQSSNPSKADAERSPPFKGWADIISLARLNSPFQPAPRW
jgi:hypothetical protein